MKEGPDISRIAALIGNPASANMLMALMAGPALTATELAHEGGIGLPTTSEHLAKLEKAGLVSIERQGRHRYYRLADHDVATALEALMPLAERAGHLRTRTGPRDPELRRARSCYDHLAGDLAVKMYDRFIDRGRTAILCPQRFRPRGARWSAPAPVPSLSRLERKAQPPVGRSRRRDFPAHPHAQMGGLRKGHPRGSIFPRRRKQDDVVVLALSSLRSGRALSRLHQLDRLAARALDHDGAGVAQPVGL